MPDAVYSVDYNGTTQLEYTYDDFGRLTERKLSPINKSQTFTYKQGGYSANSTSALVETVTVNGVVYEYVYDGDGNIYLIYGNGCEEARYYYDEFNQLIQYASPSGQMFDYAYSNGNITSVKSKGQTVKTFSYTDQNWPDKLTAVNGCQIYYDAIGNPTAYYDNKLMAWDNGRQLVGILDTDIEYKYSYDANGLRTHKDVDGTTTQFIYADGVLLGQKTGNNTLLFLYDESGGKFGFIYNGVYYYYDINLQGDVVGIYNSNGVKVVTYEYDPWGVITDITDTSGINIGTINPIRYRGYYYDNETGFYYLQSRYYDPNICRFINADGYVSTGQGVLGYNMFAYCNNNPVNYLDIDGEFPWHILIGGVIYGGSNFVTASAFAIVDIINKEPLHKIIGKVAVSTVIGVAEGSLVATLPQGAMVISACANMADTAICGIIDGESASEIITNTIISCGVGAISSSGSEVVKGKKLINSAIENWNIPKIKGIHPKVKKAAQTVKNEAKKFIKESYIAGQIEDLAYGLFDDFVQFIGCSIFGVK